MKATLKKLENMMGQRYLYLHNKIVINDYDHDDDGIISIFTSTKTYTFTTEEAEQFIEDCEFIPDSQQTAMIKPLVESSSDMFRSMQKIMEETIQKVQQDKEYVPQATQINNSIKNMLEMSKQQIEVVKILKRG